MKKYIILLALLSGCIGEDIIKDEVESGVRFTNPVSSIAIDSDFQFEYMVTNNIGMEIAPDMITWTSSDETKLTISQLGLASTHDYGIVFVTIQATIDEIIVEASLQIEISDETMMMQDTRMGTIATTSSYLLKGDFELSANGNDLTLTFASNYAADTGLPGLYVYLSNNPNSSAGAKEIAAVRVFNGAHSYDISNVGLFDYQYVLYYCKPFNVKVGHGEIKNPQ